MSIRKRLEALEAATIRQDEPPMITPDMTAEEAAQVYRRACQYRGGMTGPDEAFKGTPEEATIAYRELIAELYGTEAT